MDWTQKFGFKVFTVVAGAKTSSFRPKHAFDVMDEFERAIRISPD